MTSNRPKRSAHGAVKQVQQHIQAGYRHCVDMDLAQPTEEGRAHTAGGSLSPLLSNVLLDDLDKELEKRGLRFVRLRRRLPCIYQIRGSRQACLRIVGSMDSSPRARLLLAAMASSPIPNS